MTRDDLGIRGFYVAWLGFFIASLVGCGASEHVPAASTTSVVYGPDNRLDLLDPRVTEMARHRAQSVALLAAFADLAPSESPETMTLASRPLAQALGLCADVAFARQPAAGFCSAFLIAPNLVATAGHCLASARDCERMAVVFDYFAAPDRAASVIRREAVYRCRRVVARELRDDGVDFAVLELDRSVLDRPALRVDPRGWVEPGQPVALVGHPSGLPMKVAPGGYITAFSLASPFFRATVDAFRGNSGSPVFDSVTGTVKGILVRGLPDYVPSAGRSCLVANRCVAPDCPGDEVVRSSELARFIP